MKVRGAWLAIAAVAISVTGFLPPLIATAATNPPPVGAVTATLFSDPHESIENGVAREFDPTNSTTSGYASSALLYFTIHAPADTFSFDIEPPTGASLKVGYYPHAVTSPNRSASHPVLDIYGDGGGCNAVVGWFEVRDIAFAATGAVARLNLLYEQHCEGLTAALFGQIQIGQPGQGNVLVSSSSITWPPLEVPAAAAPAPIYVRNTGASPFSVGAARLSGVNSAMYSVTGDQCSSRVLAPGASCVLTVQFNASTRGPHSATLVLPMSTGQRVVQLDGVVAPGTTSLNLSSQPGDWVGSGGQYSYTPATATFDLSSAPSVVFVNVGSNWEVEMVAPTGHVLAPGHYANAGPPYQGSNPGLAVSGEGRGCNQTAGSFTVKQAVFSPVDGRVEHFDAAFAQHCVGSSAELTGEIRYDTVPTTTPPPNVTKLTASTVGHQLDLTWSNPTVAQWRQTIVRIQPAGAVGVAPTAGTAVYSGSGTAAAVGGLAHGAKYWVTVFTLDEWGNVGVAEVLGVVGS